MRPNIAALRVAMNHYSLALALNNNHACLRVGTQTSQLVRVRCCSGRTASTSGHGEERTGAAAAAAAGAPWNIINYITKKKERRTDELGRFVQQSPETLWDPIGWTKDAQVALALEVVARDAGLTQEQVLDRVRGLHALLPSLSPRLDSMKPGEVARMALRLEELASRLIALRDGPLPYADLGRMVAHRPELLTHQVQEVEAALEEAGTLLGHPPDLEQLVERQPALLDTQLLRQVLGEMGRLFGVSDPAACCRMLRSDPDLWTSLQPLAGQQRGDRDPETLADMLQASLPPQPPQPPPQAPQPPPQQQRSAPDRGE